MRTHRYQKHTSATVGDDRSAKNRCARSADSFRKCRTAELPVQPPDVRPPPQEKIAFTIAEAIGASGIGRTTLYALMKTGELRAIKLGRKTLIPAQGLYDFLSRLPVKRG